MDFYENLKNACEKQGIKVTTFIETLGMTSANTGAWKNGGFPRTNKLIEIADALSVSTDYLLGREQRTDTNTQVIPYDGENPKIYEIERVLEQDNLPDEVISFIWDALKRYKK